MITYNLDLENKISNLRLQLEAINKEILAAEVPYIAKYRNPLRRAQEQAAETVKALSYVELNVVDLNKLLKESTYYQGGKS